MSRIFAISFLICWSVFLGPAPAMSSGDHHADHDKAPSTQKQKIAAKEHPAPGIPGGEEIEIQGEILEGVQALVIIQNRKQEYFRQGSQNTHRIIARFKEVATGQLLTVGEAVINFTDNHDKAGSFEIMQQRGKEFACEVSMLDKGELHFLLAVRLEEDMPRTYHLHAVFND